MKELKKSKNVYLAPLKNLRALKLEIERLAQLNELSGILTGVNNRRSPWFARKVEITITVKEVE